MNKAETFLEKHCADQLREIAEKYPEKTLVKIDYIQLERFDQAFADECRAQPLQYVEEFVNAIRDMRMQNTMGMIEDVEVGFTNFPPEYSPSNLRKLNERHRGKLIRIEGIVAQISETYDKMTEAAFQCPHGHITMVPQRGNIFNVTRKPSFCRECAKATDMQLIEEECKMTSAQIMILTDKPEFQRAGEKSTMLMVYLTGELARTEFDMMKKIVVDGVFCLAPNPKKSTDQKFLRYVKAMDITTVEKTFEDITITPEDEVKIKELAKNPLVLDKLAACIAPSVEGHHHLKRSLMLQLFGGTEKHLTDAARRYWINILLMTDPSMAKSVLLNAVANLAPLSIYTTGKGSSTGGLTSTAEKDGITGLWTVKPGVMAQASGGLIAVDEFGMLSEDAMDSMREAMEQGAVSCSKAGMNLRFKSHTATLAAANPKKGRFDNFTPFVEQFGIPSPVVSRFDLIFIICDKIEVESDERIARKIFQVHTGKIEPPAIEYDLIRKYIAYAKQHFQPMLEDNAEDHIVHWYSKLRQTGKQANVVPLTTRQLEGIIRMAEASAKCRLVPKGTIHDIQIATELFYESMKESGAYNESTGVFDVDVINVGQQKNQRDRYRLVELTIADLEKSSGDNTADHDMLMEALVPGEMTEEEFDKFLAALKSQGRIYSPRHGHYKITGQ